MRRCRAGAGDDHAEGARRDLRARRSPRRCSGGWIRMRRSSRSGPEGEWRDAGAGVLRVDGSARALLTGERTALNFLGRLSGIATATARVVRAVEEPAARAKILDTRKTTPGPAAAGEAGGGGRRRRQPPRRALRRDPDQGEPLRRGRRRRGGGAARARRPAGPAARRSRCATPAEIDAALAAGAPRLLLDNMTPDEIRAAVRAGRRPGGARGIRRGRRRDSFGLCDH